MKIYEKNSTMKSLEEYELLIYEAVGTATSWTECEKNILEPATPKPVVAQIGRLYERILIDNVNFNLTEAITYFMKQRNAKFIREFRDAHKELQLGHSVLINYVGGADRLTKITEQRIQQKQIKLLDVYLGGSEKGLQKKRSIVGKLKRLFDRLATYYAPDKPEEELCNLLVAWFKSATIDKSTRIKIQKLKSTIVLQRWKETDWSVTNSVDPYLYKFQQALGKISTTDFVRKKDISAILDIFVSEPQQRETTDPTGTKLTITTRTIFFSDLEELAVKRQDWNTFYEIDIIAKDGVIGDCSLSNQHWNGKNLCIATEKMNVRAPGTVINLSGLELSSSQPKADPNRYRSYGENGRDGVDGRAGNSSGNLAILTNEIINRNNLSVILNGANGENGSNGEDGADGRNGTGTTEAELDVICKKYDSLYRTAWSEFENWNPSGWKCTLNQCNTRITGGYVYKTYVNEDDQREIIYSLAGDAGFWYTAYDFYFLIKGSNGTIGGRGGRNGLGGEGGRQGEALIAAMTTGESYDVNTERRLGTEGENGRCGNPGISGKNGNDIAYIDRSASEASKFIYGKNTLEKLSFEYTSSAEKFSRLDGHRKWILKDSHPFIRLKASSIEDGMKQENTAARTISERTSTSKAVCKATVVTESIVKEFNSAFEGDEVVLQDACKSLEQEMEEMAEDELESEEVVQQEIAVIRQHDDDKLFVSNDQSSKQQIHITVEELTQQIARLKSNVELPMSSDIFEQTLQTLLKFYNVESDSDQLWKNVKSIQELMLKMLNKSEYFDKLFADRSFYCNMNKEAVKRFLSTMTNRLDHKAKLSRFEPTPMTKPPEDHSIDFSLDELQDVSPAELTNEVFLNYLLDQDSVRDIISDFYKDCGFYLAKPKLLMELFRISMFLKSQAEDILEPFEAEDICWANPKDVTTHLTKLMPQERQTEFMTPEEITELNQNYYSDEMVESSIEAEEEEEEDDDEDVKLEEEQQVEPEKKKSRFQKMKEEMEKLKKKAKKAFKKDKNISDIEKVDKFVKEHEKNLKGLVGKLDQMVTSDSHLQEHFLLQSPGYRQKFFGSGSCNLCESSSSVIHIYYLSRQMLQFNIKFYKYESLFKTGIFVPTKWIASSEPENESTMLASFISSLDWSNDNDFNNEAKTFMLRNGLRCAAFRSLLADTEDLHIRLFTSNGSSSMRLVEEVNSSGKNKIYLNLDCTGEFHDIQPNLALRKFRAEIVGSMSTECSLLDETTEASLSEYFNPAFKPIVDEWCNAVVATTSTDEYLRLIHEIFYVNGCHVKLFDLQFIISTYLEMNINRRVPSRFICNMALTEQDQLDEFTLLLRIFSQINHTEAEPPEVMNKIFAIEDSRIRALFGSKLHEMPLTKTQLFSILDMMKHADDNIRQLEKMHLKEWLDIADRQNWNEVGSLMDKFGTVGYYLSYLDTLKRNEVGDFKKMVQNLSKDHFIIMEKVVAKIVFLIAANEINFTSNYCNSVKNLLSECMKNLQNAKLNAESDVRKHHSFEVLVNESVQNIIIAKIANGKSTQEIWNEVFPKEQRSLSKLIELIVNPQDDGTQKLQRLQKHQQLIHFMENVRMGLPTDSQNKLYFHMATLLARIDDGIFERRKIRLRDTQKMAVLIAATTNRDVISQVNTGEGKSYIISTLAIMRILSTDRRDSVDVITSSSVLAQRDADDQREIYNHFGISVGDNCDEDVEARKMAYKCNVVYGDIARFQRDYLLQTFYKKNILGSRKQCNVIVDEVDNMLLDNGNNMLYLSHSVAGLDLLDSLFIFIHKQINMPLLDDKAIASNGIEKQFNTQRIRQIVLADMCGMINKSDIVKVLCSPTSQQDANTAWRILVQNKVLDRDGVLEECSEEELKQVEEELKKECGVTLTSRVMVLLKIVNNRDHDIRVPKYLHGFAKRHLDEFIENAKKALFMKQDEEYVIDLDHTKQSSDLCPQITIIDRNTGVDLVTSQWSEGLHQFLQLKHGCRLSPISLKAVFISNVSYLKGYNRLNGFSGTLGSKEESLSLVDLYGTDLVRIPTWKPKDFYENVPQVATTEVEWIQNVFDEVCDQVIARRSVLVICSSIGEVDRLCQGMKQLYANLSEKDKNQKVVECFENLITYTRQFDEFDFSDTGYLPSRLIISTNLAGRGTDIKLSDQLIEAGGLHVIVSFLPDNSRIEDQAYGRASRCGQPGSGQIIALVDKSMVSEGEAPNIFKMKQFRDNAEVHRLQSLKKFYVYHTEVEETCLNMFREHCGDGCSGAYGSGDSGDLPSALQVIYFSLLDEWALWLDSKAEDIHRCAKECNNTEKLVIIDSVRKFLELHPVTKETEIISTKESVEEMLEFDPMVRIAKTLAVSLSQAYTFRHVDITESVKWIQCPQPLLTLALIQIADGNTELAMTILDDILYRFPDYGAEAMYYKGCIAQVQIRELKDHYLNEEQRSNGWRGAICSFFDDIAAAVPKMIFSEAKNWAPESLVENVAEHHEEAVRCFMNSRGLFSTRVESRQEAVNLVQRLQQAPSNQQMKSTGFMDQHKQISAVYETVIGNIDDMVGHVITPSVVSDKNEATPDDVLLYKSYLRSGILTPSVLQKDISDAQYKLLQHKHGIPPTVLRAAFEQAWKRKSAEFSDGMPIITSTELAALFNLPSATDFWNVLREEGCFLQEISYIAVRRHNVAKLDFLEGKKPSTLIVHPMLLQLSMTDLSSMQLYEITEGMKNDAAINEILTAATSIGLLTVEVFGILNVIQLNNLRYLCKFDSIVEDTLIDNFDLSLLQAMWILDTLLKHGVLEKELVAYHFQKTVEKEAEASSAENGLPAIPSVTIEEATVIRPVYRLVQKADFSMLPEAIQPAMELLFSRSFAYGYALKALRSSLNSTIDEASIDKKHRIMLPTDPYLDMYNDMIQFGICRAPRVMSGFDVSYDDDLMPEKQYDKLKGKMGNILDAAANMVPTQNYLVEKHVPASGEVRKSISNGLKQLAVVEKPRIWKWFIGIFVAIANIVMAVAKAVVGLLVTAVCSLMELTALAPVGTTAYFLNLMITMMRSFSRTEAQEQEEYTLLQDYHERAVQKMYKQKVEDAIYKAIHQYVDAWQKRMSKKIRIERTNFIANTELSVNEIDNDVREEVRLCIEESRFTDLIRNALSLWSQIATQKLQNVIYRQLARAVFLDKMDEHDLNSEILKQTESLAKELTVTPALTTGYQLIVNDLNELFEKRSINIQLEVDDGNEDDEVDEDESEEEDGSDTEYENGNESKDEDDSDDSLISLVYNSFKLLITSIYSKSVERNLRSADLRLTNYLYAVRNKNFGSAQLDDESIEKKKVMHLDERTVATKMSSDFLARDLQNVFLRICYQNPREEVIAHMLQYNYPLSAHCSTIVFEALFSLLDEKRLSVPKCTIRLKRENVVIYEFAVRELGVGTTISATIDVSLIKDCYIISEKADVAENSNSMSSLFEHLQDNIPRFGATFMTGSTDFRIALMEAVKAKKRLDRNKFSVDVAWNGTEALQWNKSL